MHEKWMSYSDFTMQILILLHYSGSSTKTEKQITAHCMNVGRLVRKLFNFPGIRASHFSPPTI